MKILKVLICNTLVIFLLSSNIHAADDQLNVTIPTFDITINNSLIDSTQMQYPLIVHKDITYFPLTWNWCAAMGLASGYTAVDGLYVANYISGEPFAYNIDQYDEGGYQRAGSRFNASMPMYPVFINGDQIHNDKEPYPLLNFRGITYFPLTWRFVVDEFGWDMFWDDETGFHISSNGRAKELPPGTAYENVSIYTEDGYQEHSVVLQCIENRAVDAVQNEGGGFIDRFVSESIERYRLIYNTNELLPIDSDEIEMEPYNSGAVTGEAIDAYIEVQGDRLLYKDKLLLDLSDTIRKDESIEYLYATNYQVNGINVLTLKVYFLKYGERIPVPFTPQSHYVLVDYGEGIYKQMLEWPTTQVPSRVFPYGEDGAYLCSDYNRYSGTRSSNGRGRLVLIESNESATVMNDLWSDWNSIRSLGMDDKGNLYLLNTWCPDEDPFIGGGKVSPVRDGYFKLATDGEITKLFPFIQSEKTVVTPSGDIYMDIARKNSLLHLQSGTWIQP